MGEEAGCRLGLLSVPWMRRLRQTRPYTPVGWGMARGDGRKDEALGEDRDAPGAAWPERT